MKITSLKIDGFGIFHDLALDRLPRNLVLVLGDNEAGKSTMLGFLRGMLFGLAAQSAGEPEYPPLRGGRHGGALGLELDGGERHTLERYAGAGGERICVTTAEGRVYDVEELSRMLAGTSRELFKNIYAFSLGELQSFESLRTEQVRGAIYGAATGTALLALPHALDALGGRMGELFSPAGHSAAINTALRALEGTRNRLRQARGEIAQHETLVDQLRQIDQDIGALGQRNAAARARLEQVKACQRAWPDWIEIQRAEAELAGQPTAENFPENGLTMLETENAAIAGLQQQLDRLGEQRGRLAREIEALVLDERVLREAVAIELLAGELGRAADLRQGLQDLARERQGVEESINRSLEYLGRDWTRERVQSLNRSLFTRETILRQQQALEDAEKALERADDLLADRQAAAGRAAQEQKAAEEALRRFAGLGAPADPALQEELKKRRGQFASLIPELPLAQRQQSQAEARLDEILREINPAWTSQDLARFDSSIAAHQKIESYEARLGAAAEELAEAQGAAAAAGRRAEEIRPKVAQGESRLAALPRPRADKRDTILGRIQAARALRATLATLESAARETGHGEQRLEDRRQDLERLESLYAEPQALAYPWAPLALGLLALLAGAALLGLKYLPAAAPVLDALKTRFALSGELAAAIASLPLGAGLAGCGLLLIVAAAVSAHRRRLRNEAEAREAESHRAAIAAMQETIATLTARQNELLEAEEAPRQQAQRLAGDLGLSTVPGAADLDDADVKLQEILKEFDAWQAARQELNVLQGEAARAAEARDRADKAAAEKYEALARLKDQWKKHLAQLGLPAELTPRAAFQVFSRVETARRLAETLEGQGQQAGQLRRFREETRALAARVPALCPLPADDGDLLARADSFFERERHDDERRHQRDLAQAALAEKKELAQAAQAAQEQARAAEAQVREQWQKTLQGWRGWLRASGLPEDLSPQATLEVFRLVGNCLDQIAHSAEQAARMDALRGEIKAFEGRAAALFTTLGRPVPEEARLTPAVMELARELKDYQERRPERQEKARQLADIEQRQGALREEAEEHRRKVGWLLASVAAEDEADFRRRHTIAHERARLAQLWLTVLKVAGETGEDALRATLSATSGEALHQQEQLINQQFAATEQEMERLRQRRAELAHRIESMEKSDRIVRLRAEEEMLLAEIRAQALDWARHAVARHLLEEGRARFERDQQPSVIRQASGFFTRMTGGQYEGLIVPLGQNSIEAVAADGSHKRLEELSRGTAEQLYLAVRGGYIQQRARDNERLPVIMDDILVNFDARRAALAAEMILELAESHQVFYFTCHRETVERFRAIRPQLPYFELTTGQFTYHEEPAPVPLEAVLPEGFPVELNEEAGGEAEAAGEEAGISESMEETAPEAEESFLEPEADAVPTENPEEMPQDPPTPEA